MPLLPAAIPPSRSDYWKVAPTVLAAVIVTEQIPVPEQAPVHPLNRLPADGVAVSVTCVPALKAVWQLVPQLMPRGLLLTLPLPDILTLSTKVDGAKVTATDFEAVRLTEHVVPLLLVQPDHPLTPLPVAGVAVRVTVDPVAKLAAQTEPQLIPAGELVREPLPVLETLNVLTAGANVAATVFDEFIVREQLVPLAVVHPVQPEIT